MKILLVSPLPPPAGGIASWTERLLANWPRNYELVHYNSAVKPSSRFPGVLGRIMRGMKKTPNELLRLRSLVKENDIDICHVATSGHLGFMRDILIACLMKALGKKTIFHMRFGRVPQLCRSRNWESLLLSMLFRISDGFIAIDLATFSALTAKYGHDKIFYVPNFVDMKHFPDAANLDQNRVKGRLFFSGNIVEEKGIRELFEACSKMPRAHLVLAGKCTDEFKAELLNKYPDVQSEFLGILPKEEVMRQLQLCDLFVFPSYTEGFPNSVAEAMGCGCAIIATPVGAIPEMLNANDAENPCGVLVEVKSAQALRAAIEKMLSDQKLSRVFGRRARERVEREYSEVVVINKLCSVWGTFLNA